LSKVGRDHPLVVQGFKKLRGTSPDGCCAYVLEDYSSKIMVCGRGLHGTMHDTTHILVEIC